MMGNWCERMSHPVWVRGLKLPRYAVALKYVEVAPRVGAWIETLRIGSSVSRLRSHPVWVRGLKLAVSFPLVIARGRTPCGCVD